MIRRLPSGQGPVRGAARPRSAGATRPYTRRPGGPGMAELGERGARNASGPARRIRAPRPRRLSGRAAALGLLALALMLAYGYPVRAYLAQRAEINQMQADQAAQRERIERLTERLERWDDPNYVITQVRTRLRWVRAGELTYLVVQEPPPAQGQARTGEDSAWFSQLWGNVQAADNIDDDNPLPRSVP